MSKIANPYKNYSAETLGYAIEEAYRQLSVGAGNSERLLAMVEQMSEALEQKRQTDFCQHGVFLYGDVSPACWQCESGE
jgi:hypothetical protein